MWPPQDEDDFHHALGGEGIDENHCEISFDHLDPMRAITLIPKDGICLVNGKSVEKQTTLQHNDRLILGLSQVFHLFDPQVAMGDGSLGAKVIDWDMAQEEVAAGLNAMVHQRWSCSRAASVEPHKPRAHDTGQQKGRGRDEADPKRVDAAASAREGEAD